MASITIARRGSALLKQGHPRFEGSDLLGFHVLVHALSLQPARASTFPSTRPFGLSGFERSDDEIVQLRQDVSRKEVDL